MDFYLLSLSFTIIEKCSIFALIQLICNEKQQFVIILKLATVLVPYLMNAVKELKENLWPVFKILIAVVSTSLMEHVSKAKPIFLYKHFDSFKSPVKWIQA